MRIEKAVPAVFLSLCLFPGGLTGQVLQERTRRPVRFETSQALESLSAAIHSTQQTDAPAQGSRLGSRILTGLGVGILGAGIGFFASQVAESDWDENRADRTPWALVGGGVGVAVGFSFPISFGSPSGPSLPMGRTRDILSFEEIQEALSQPIGEERENITAADMRRAVVTDALELVNLLRPEWLIQRGVGTFGDRNTETIRVYVDSQELGGIESLELVQITVIRSVRFLDGAHATALFGAGHTQGVIQVLTQD